MNKNLRLERVYTQPQKVIKHVNAKEGNFQHIAQSCPKHAMLVLKTNFQYCKKFHLYFCWMTYIWRLAGCQLNVKAMDVPHLGETSFLITIFLLPGCATCTLWFVPKYQNIFPSSHNVHLKIRTEDAKGKFECEPNKVYKGYFTTRIWLNSHSFRIGLLPSVLRPFF